MELDTPVSSARKIRNNFPYPHAPLCEAAAADGIEPCICDYLTAAHEQGYKEAEEFYTNSCMMCGYAGEWSTWICDDCLKENDAAD